MIKMTVRIDGLKELQANFRKAPAITLKWLGKATQAAIFEVEKQAVDKNFQFKTPRSMRTGYLSLSFSYGRSLVTTLDNRVRGTIGPTARYAPYVYFGTSRGIQPNPFMDRIAKAAEPAVGKHFEKALGKITEEIAAI